MPHGRHAPGIRIYVLTIPALLMPNSPLTSPSTSQTQIQQVNQYAHHPYLRTTILCPLRLLPPPPLKALSLTDALCFLTSVSPKFYY
jgi:hypothetical protein